IHESAHEYALGVSAAQALDRGDPYKSGQQNRRRSRPETLQRGGERSVFRVLAARQRVADAQNRLDATLATRQQRQLLANVADVRLEQVRVALVVVAPCVFDQAAVRNDAAFVQGEHVQDAELEPRQLDRLASLGDFVRLQIEDQVAHAHLRGGLAVRVGLAAAHNGLHARSKLFGAEWLGHVIVGADLQAAQDVLFLVAGGQHDDRRLRLVPNAAADFEAIDLGQVAVEQDDVRVFAFPALQRLLAIHGRQDVVALEAQRVRHQIQQIHIVVDDKN